MYNKWEIAYPLFLLTIMFYAEIVSISFASQLKVGWYTVTINADLMDHKIVNFTPSTVWSKDEMDGRPSCSK